MTLNPIPAVTRLRFLMTWCRHLVVQLKVQIKKPHIQTNGQESRVYLEFGHVMWSDSNASSSVFTSKLIHHLLGVREGGRERGSWRVFSGGGGQQGWLINQTTSTQPPNTLTRQGICIPLHTCQETVQQWIITADRVLWRGKHVDSDRHSQGKEAIFCSFNCC